MEEAQRQQERANFVQEVVDGIQKAIPNAFLQEPDETPPPAEPTPPPVLPLQDLQALLTQQQQPNQQQQQLVNQYMQQLQQMQTLLTQLMNNGIGNGNHPNGRQHHQRTINCYCWMHGAFGHTSNECRTHVEGHQEAATFQYCMGGSTRT